MFAVIKTGGKQYKVAANDVLKIEKLPATPGEIVTFNEVLMVGNGDDVTVGAPLVDGAMVAAELIGTRKQKTVIILKKHRRQHYDRRNGHRQLLSSVRITEILTGGAQPTIEGRAQAAAPAAETTSAPKPRRGKASPAGETAAAPAADAVAPDAELPAAEQAKPAKRGATRKAAPKAKSAGETADAAPKKTPTRKAKPKAGEQE
jgi:large subunit ribosomal protein L21